MLLAVATPMHMMAPISDGTLSVVPVTNSIHRMPAIAPGRAVRMMNGSSQDWKFTVISRYTRTTAKIIPNPRRKKDDCMVSTCPRRANDVPRGRCGSSSRMIFSHFRADAAQIPPVDIGIHIKHRPDVVVVDDHRRVASVAPMTRFESSCVLPAIGSGISVGLGRAARRGADEALPAAGRARLRTRRGAVHGAGRRRNRRAQQRVQGIDPVLRRLHADVVVDAVRPVHPVVRRHRAAAAERDQHAAGDVALRQAQSATPSRDPRSGGSPADPPPGERARRPRPGMRAILSASFWAIL